MSYEIDDEVGVATFNWFTGDKLQRGTVVGFAYSDGVVVQLDNGEVTSFETSFGFEQDTVLKRVLINKDNIADIESELRPNCIYRGVLAVYKWFHKWD